MTKVVHSMTDAINSIRHGATIMFGGFGLCGIPENAIKALQEKGIKDLTCISNNAGVADYGLGLLMVNRQIKKMISTYVGENKVFETQCLNGEIEVELVPQGTFSERIRAGGAGIAAFFTPTGVGTIVAEGKESREFNGKTYILEQALHADVAIIKAYKADTQGNLIYRKSARNFNPIMATAADFTIAEVEEIVAPGDLDSDQIITPGVFIDVVVKGDIFEKRIEQRTTISRS